MNTSALIHQQTQIENGFISFLKCINDKILNINIKTHVYISKGQGQAFLIGNTQVMTYSIGFLHFLITGIKLTLLKVGNCSF